MASWKVKRPARLLATVLLAPLVLFAMLSWFEHRQVFIPYAEWAATGAALGCPWEDLSLTNQDGLRLSAWFFPAAATAAHRHRAVVVCHGNGGNLSHRLDLYAVLLEAGVNVLAFDYRGYGKSEGKPTEAGTYVDSQAAYEWLRQRNFEASNIVAYGESLGGAVAAELAVRVPLGGLVLQSTFTSVPDLGAEIFPWLPVRTLGSIRYQTKDKLPHLRLPILILHSRADTIVPFHHGEKLFALANEPKMFCELIGDHNNTLPTSHDQLISALQRFLDRLDHPSPGPPSRPQ